MQIDWSPVLEALIKVLVVVLIPLLGTLISVWLTKLINKLKAEIGTEQWEQADKIIRDLVTAAEQYGLWDATKSIGEQKKAWVIERATQILTERHIYIDVESIADLIEAKVAEQFNWKRFTHKDEPVANGIGFVKGSNTSAPS